MKLHAVASHSKVAYGKRKLRQVNEKLKVSLLVCDTNSKECMIHRCPNCPDTSNLTTYLTNLLIDIEWSSDDKEIDADYEINVDRSQLVQQSLPVKEFIEVLDF